MNQPPRYPEPGPRYPTGYSDDITDAVREALSYGVIPGITLSDFDADLRHMNCAQREDYVQTLWDRLQ